MKRILAFFGVLLMIMVACGTDGDSDESDDSDPPLEETEPIEDEEETSDSKKDEELTVLAENLQIPWSIQKDDDTIYLSERTGTIAKIENEEVERQVVELEMELSEAEEAGLLGFVLDPDFTNNKEAFAYYTYTNEAGPMNRIVKLRLNEDTWFEEKVLLDEIPSGDFHHGGRLAFGPDEKLYATTGDTLQSDLAQELDSLAGKILRLNQDGSTPEDNPIADSYVYSYGHRNAQGLTWLAHDEMYASEHGDNANDEINRIEPNENYGWPIIEGDEKQDGLVSPVFTSGEEDTWAPSGMASKEQILYVAGLRGNAVYAFDLENEQMEEYLTEFGRIRDVYIEDNFLYLITNNTDGRGEPEENDDRLIRVPLSKIE